MDGRNERQREKVRRAADAQVQKPSVAPDSTQRPLRAYALTDSPTPSAPLTVAAARWTEARSSPLLAVGEVLWSSQGLVDSLAS